MRAALLLAVIAVLVGIVAGEIWILAYVFQRFF